MADIVQIDATQGAGEPLYLGFAKANQVITKINAIEAGATQDQSGAEIKALLEALIDKLSIAAVKETDTKKILTAAERTSLAANVAKLAGIEVGAKDDQIAAEVPIADAGGIITAIEVEAALQEIMTDLDAAEVAAAAAQADIDGFPDELKNLVAHEIEQIENMADDLDISAAQWGFVGDMNLGISIGNVPAFLVHPTAIQANVAFNTNVEIVWGTEIYDQGGNFAANTFTTPVTGKYSFHILVRLDAIDTDATMLELKLVTSNRTYYSYLDPSKFSGDLTSCSMHLSVIADMDATETALVQIYQTGGAAQMDVDVRSWFSGVLVA